MVYGPTKKKIVAPKNTMKKTNIPIEYKASRHVPLLYLFEEDFSDPAKPDTPSSRNTIEEIYSPMSEADTADWLAELMIDFFSTWT